MPTVYDTASLAHGNDTNIRLVELIPGEVWCDGEQYQVHCKFHVMPLSSKPKYTAVSYMWGEDTNTSDIVLNGKVFGVRNNLFDLLVTLSETGQTLLWVDAICIDQESIDERNHQVGLMGSIYSQARSVLVWLGSGSEEVADALGKARLYDDAISGGQDMQPGGEEPSTDDLAGNSKVSTRQHRFLEARKASVEALDSALNEQSLFRSLSEPLIPTEQKILDELIALCQDPYWSRAWIVQELILAGNVQIRCNEVQVELEALEARLAQVRTWFRGRKLLIKPPKVVAILESPAAKLLAKRSKWQESRGRTYINPWESGFGILGCSDVRDRVYAMAALMDPNVAVTPDYSKTPSDVFRDIFERHLRRTGAFAGVIWNLQSMLELTDAEPIIRHAKQFGSFEWTPAGSLASR